MTLTKAIEAAREHMKNALNFEYDHTNCAKQALAALPAKPKSEDGIEGIINKASIACCGTIPYPDLTRAIISALKAANCLYVEE